MKAVIFGLKGLNLTDQERLFFQKANPIGFILFSRNFESSQQISNLIKDLKATVGRDNVLILVDQEGGRVQRAGPSLGYSQYPPASIFSKMAETSLNVAEELCRINYQLIGLDLFNLGITINCAPCIDLLYPEANKIIGDRSFGDNPQIVAALGQSAIYGLKEAGIMPIIKHIPGHGRALVDSHDSLPIIDLSINELENDFTPFKELSLHAEIAMTAHILYTAIDKDNPITLSKKAIDFIREVIGFRGIIISDDLSMKALSGSIGNIGSRAYRAGCDILLHCNGDLSEMEQLAALDIPVNYKVEEILINKNSKLAEIIENKVKEVDSNFLLNTLKEKTGFHYEIV